MRSLRWRRRRYELAARLGRHGHVIGGPKHLVSSVLWPQVLRQLHWWVRAAAVVTIVATIAGLLAVVGFSPGECLVGALIMTGSLWVALGVVGFVGESRSASTEGGPLPPGAGQREPRRPSPAPPAISRRRPVPGDPSR